MKNIFFEYWQGINNRPYYVQQHILIGFAKTVEDYMKLRNISKKELAKKLKRSKTYVVEVLRGDRNLTMLDIAKISIALQFNIELIVTPRDLPIIIETPVT